MTRVGLIGCFGALDDEGMRKLCRELALVAERNHQVIRVESRNFCSGRSWRALREFKPSVLHYLTGPTFFSVAALRAHKGLLPGHPRTIATGVRPFLGRRSRFLLRTVAPDCFLAQSRNWERLFARAGSLTIDFPNWVDTSRFRPATEARRAQLKAAKGLPVEKPLVLHVGHIKENRNLESLLSIQRSGRYQVWVIGSKSESRRGPLHDRLVGEGCIVDTTYQPAIEEAYQAADAYLFTVRPPRSGSFPRRYQEVGAIDFPLSVLEAMASGLPVVSTLHDALAHFVGRTAGMRYFDGSGAHALVQLDAVLTDANGTRVQAEAFDAGLLAARLDTVYDRVCKGMQPT